MTTPLIEKVQSGVDLDPEDLALLQTLAGMQEAQEPEPDDRVAHRGDSAVPAMVRTTTKSAGYVYLRRNSDGKLKEINRNQLTERLRQKLEDGRPAWLPPNVPWQGKARIPDKYCLLSAHHPDRPHMDDLNLEVCAKRGKLMGVAALRRHMARKHKDSWEVIQQDTRDAREAKMSAALTAALQGRAAPDTGTEPTTRSVTVTCDVPGCGAAFASAARIAATNLLKAHKRREHRT